MFREPLSLWSPSAEASSDGHFLTSLPWGQRASHERDSTNQMHLVQTLRWKLVIRKSRSHTESILAMGTAPPSLLTYRWWQIQGLFPAQTASVTWGQAVVSGLSRAQIFTRPVLQHSLGIFPDHVAPESDPLTFLEILGARAHFTGQQPV